MTNKERVLQKWPDSKVHLKLFNGNRFYAVFRPTSTRNISKWLKTPQAAWADAAKRMEK